MVSLIKIPIFLAHGEEALLVFGGIILVANGVALTSVVVALRNKQDTKSVGALVLGTTGYLLAVAMASLMRWQFDQPPFSWGIISLFLLSTTGLVLSIRKKVS